MMPAPPLPEKAADFRHIGPAGYILQSPVIDGHHGSALKGFAVIIRELDFKAGIFTRPVRFLRRRDCYIQHSLFRRHNNFTGLSVQPTLIDRKSLHKKVGHIFLRNENFFNRAFAGHVDDFGRQVNTIGRAHEQHHSGTRIIGIDQEPDTIPRRIFTAVRNQFDFGKPILSAVISLAAYGENVAALDGVILCVSYLVRQTILPGLRSLELNPGLARSIRIQFPLLEWYRPSDNVRDRPRHRL
jgi:hypothetical protein